VPVDLNEWGINPRHVVAKAGQPVRFELTNTGGFNHSLSIEGQGQAWHSDVLASGAALDWNLTISQPGIYQIWCPVAAGGHRDRGMIGTLVVVEPQEEPVLPVVVLLDEWSIQPLSAVTVAGQNTRFDLRHVGTMSTHSITIVGQGIVLDSPAFAAGESGTWDVVLSTPGTYEVYCPRGNGSHRERGMVGTLEVLPGGRM
jgi:plastocyanin